MPRMAESIPLSVWRAYADECIGVPRLLRVAEELVITTA